MRRPDCEFQGRSYITEKNKDPGSIFLHPLVREIVLKNLVDVKMGYSYVISNCGLSDGPYAEVVRSDYAASIPNGPGDQLLMLARWLEMHTIVDSFQRNKTLYSFFVSSLMLDERGTTNTRMLGLRIAYEVYAALSNALGMESFLTYARAVTDQYASLFGGLLRPDAPADDQTWNWKLAELLRDAHAQRFRLPSMSDGRGAWIDYLRLIVNGERKLRDLGRDGMGRQFATYMDERFRPFILPIWPAGCCDLIAERLRSRDWDGQEAAEVDFLLIDREHPTPPHELLRTNREEYVRRTKEIDLVLEVARADGPRRVEAYQNIVTWLGEHSDDLSHLVRPVGLLRPPA